MRLFLIFFFLLFLLTACFREIEAPATLHSSQMIEGTPDYEATATKLVADATAMALSLIDSGCLPQEATQWQITLTVSGDSIDNENSHARNQTTQDNWLCDGHFALAHLEYEIEVLYEAEDTDFFGLLDEMVLWLKDYPSDGLPAMQPRVLIHFHRSDVPFEEMIAAAFSWQFSYADALVSYELGLRDEDLAEALDVELP